MDRMTYAAAEVDIDWGEGEKIIITWRPPDVRKNHLEHDY